MYIIPNSRVEALRIAAKFLRCMAEGAKPTKEECKIISDMCWLQIPMKYRMSKQEIEELKNKYQV